MMCVLSKTVSVTEGGYEKDTGRVAEESSSTAVQLFDSWKVRLVRLAIRFLALELAADIIHHIAF